MSGWRYNSGWKTEDLYGLFDDRYLRKDQDDTTIGSISIKPASGNDALIIQRGKRLVLDGES